MINAHEYKSLLSISAHTAAGTQATSLIDTKGYRACRISLVANTTDAMTTMTLQQSDSTTAATFVAISGAAGGTDFTISTASAASPYTANGVFIVDLRGKKRYLRVVHGGATAQTMFASIDLFNPVDMPDSGTELGATADAAYIAVY